MQHSKKTVDGDFGPAVHVADEAALGHSSDDDMAVAAAARCIREPGERGLNKAVRGAGAWADKTAVTHAFSSLWVRSVTIVVSRMPALHAHTVSRISMPAEMSAILAAFMQAQRTLPSI